MLRTAIASTFLLMVAGALQPEAASTAPDIAAGSFTTLEARRGLEDSIRPLSRDREGPAWAGYSAPAIPGDHMMCCFHGHGRVGNCDTCHLEDDRNTFVNSNHDRDRTLRLEEPRVFFVLFRFEDGRIQQVRAVSRDCHVDAGSLDFFWFDGVDPEDSVDWLASLVDRHADGGGRRDIAGEALTALAFHDLPSAQTTLIGFARRHPSGDVRGQALFWLAQAAAEKAAGTITEAIDKDPETEVKRRAVFALSQLPEDRGIPLLIDLVRTHSHPVVRREAIFWLGQTNDPRALEFIESILNG